MRRTTTLLVLVLALAAGGTACGTAAEQPIQASGGSPGTIDYQSPDDAAPEANFLGEIEARGAELSIPQQEIIDAGRSACATLAGGNSREQAVSAVRDQYGIGATDAETVVTAAVETLCPDTAPDS
jgi:hypothetical protein